MTLSFWEKLELGLMLAYNPGKKCSRGTFQLFLRALSPIGLKPVDDFLALVREKTTLVEDRIYINSVSLAQIVNLYRQGRILKMLYIIDEDFMKKLSPFEFIGVAHFLPDYAPFSAIKKCLLNMYEETLETLNISIAQASLTEQSRIDILVASNEKFAEFYNLLREDITEYGKKYDYCAKITKIKDLLIVERSYDCDEIATGKPFSYSHDDSSINVKRYPNLYLEAFFPFIYRQYGILHLDKEPVEIGYWFYIIGGLIITALIVFSISYFSFTLSLIVGIPVLMMEFLSIFLFCN